jgi:hypothetical protein
MFLSAFANIFGVVNARKRIHQKSSPKIGLFLCRLTVVYRVLHSEKIQKSTQLFMIPIISHQILRISTSPVLPMAGKNIFFEKSQVLETLALFFGKTFFSDFEFRWLSGYRDFRFENFWKLSF